MAERDPALRWFVVMQLLRLGGAAMLVAGAMTLAGTLALPKGAGAVLLVLGFAEFFFAPKLLANVLKRHRP